MSLSEGFKYLCASWVFESADRWRDDFVTMSIGYDINRMGALRVVYLVNKSYEYRVVGRIFKDNGIK